MQTSLSCRQAGTKSNLGQAITEQLEGAYRHLRMFPDIKPKDWVALGLDHLHQGVVLVTYSSRNLFLICCHACLTADAHAEPQQFVTRVYLP